MTSSLFRRDSADAHPCSFLVEAGEIRSEHLLQLVRLDLQLAAEILEYRIRTRDRLSVACVDDAQQRGDAVVDLDWKVQRILAALVLHLVDRLFNRGQVRGQSSRRISQLRVG